MIAETSPNVEVVYKKLLEMIIGFDLVPGQLLKYSDLCEDLGISRTPFLHALLLLVSSGLVEKKGNSYNVTHITQKDILEIYQLRSAIETYSISISMNNGCIKDEVLSNLEELNKKMKESNGSTAAFHYDEQFHSILVDMCENTRMKQVYNSCICQNKRLRMLSLICKTRITNTPKEHQKIIDSLRRNDLLGTQRAINSHLKRAMDNYLETVDKLTEKELITLISISKKKNVMFVE